MDLVIPKADLLPMLARCVPIAEKKSAMPALANILLATEGATLRASATDLYQGVTSAMPADIATAGSVAVPAKDLYERVKMMPAGPIQILVNVDTSAMTLKAVGSPRRYTIHGIPGGEFPHMPKPDHEATAMTMPAALLARMIAATAFSISTDETRPHVNSLCVETQGETMRAVSTDGHRMTKMDATIAGLSAPTRTMLLPLKSVGEVRRLAEGAGDASVSLHMSGPCLFIEADGVRFHSKLVDAQFPPYQQVIPAACATMVRAPRLALIDAFKAIKIATDAHHANVKVHVATNALRVTAESPESGSGFDELAVDYAGAELTIGFNAQYMLDALGAVSGDEVLLSLTGELDPALLLPGETTAGESFTAVVMPARI